MTKASEDVSQSANLAPHAKRPSATRRATLAGMVVALAAPVTAGAAPPTNNTLYVDAKIIDAADDFIRAETEFNGVSDELVHSETEAEFKARHHLFLEQTDAALEVIKNNPAKSYAGLQAKARLAEHCLAQLKSDIPEHLARPLASLVQDVLRGVTI